ncbi:hypothetical protein D3C85_1530880 [compost metagenome]
MINPFRVDLAQGLLGEIVTGIEERHGLRAGFAVGGHPAKVFLEIGKQGRAAAAVAWVEQEILHVDRDELLGAARLVDVRAAGNLSIVLFALATTADVLRPAGKVEQAWVVAEGKASIGLTATFVGHADQP